MERTRLVSSASPLDSLIDIEDSESILRPIRVTPLPNASVPQSQGFRLGRFPSESEEEATKEGEMNGGKKYDHVWSIILAGGDGERLRSLTEAWLGYHKPKQYCVFTGTRSML